MSKSIKVLKFGCIVSLDAMEGIQLFTRTNLKYKLFGKPVRLFLRAKESYEGRQSNFLNFLVVTSPYLLLVISLLYMPWYTPIESSHRDLLTKSVRRTFLENAYLFDGIGSMA